MTCRNCLAPNAPGATHCHACRMPGDFGQAPAAEARVVGVRVVACGNCAAHAPAHAERCPSCRWPLPRREATATRVGDAAVAPQPLRATG